MPYLEHLVDVVANHFYNEDNEATFTSTVKETAKPCTFQIVGGKATGTYCFITCFYGLTVMSTEFQKTKDKDLSNLPNPHVFWTTFYS